MVGTASKSKLSSRYEQDGYLSPVRLFSAQEALEARTKLEEVEASHGSLHYISKIHTLINFAAEMATAPQVLDVVEQFLGPDILLFDVTFITKEAHSSSHVSWHQDLTYWGLSNDLQVSMWLALSPATEVSGCMRMIPGSHVNGKLEHVDTDDKNNVLFRGQTVAGVNEQEAALCPLQPGEASFHHGWTLHASMPNLSDDRRIGLNVQYLHPSAKNMINDVDTATLVRGRDEFLHYERDVFATGLMEAEAVAQHAALEEKRKETWAQA